MRQGRRMRHWKERFNKNSQFIWNKPVLWDGEQVELHSPIPEALANDRNRLRRFWEAGVIQLAEFDAPDVVTGQPAMKADPDGVVPNGEPVHPEEGGNALRSETDEEVDKTFLEGNGEEEVDPALGDEEPEEPEEPDPVAADAEVLDALEDDEPELDLGEDAGEEGDEVVKIADRKWAVKGKEDKTFPTKKAALEAAEAAALED